MPHKKDEPTTIYEIKITLNGLKPPIWRRIQVSADITLLKLHKIIQWTMGWTDSHLHQFVIGDSTYKVRDQTRLAHAYRNEQGCWLRGLL